MKLIKRLNILDSELNVDLLDKNELWVSAFEIICDEDNPEEKKIYSVKPTKVMINSRIDEPKVMIKITECKGGRSLNIEFTRDEWSDDGNWIESFYVEDENDFIKIYEVEFFNTKEESENYYNNNVDKYVMEFENFINKIKGYKIS